MKKIVIIIIAFSIYQANRLYAEVAILPYKIKNPSIYFPEKTGIEYSKLLTVAALYKKKIEITSPRDIEIDLKRFGISPQGLISTEHLDMYGKIRYLDYILAGTVAKVKNKFISKSILYSIRDKKAVFRIKIKADSLFKLAEKEINRAFSHIPDINRKSSSISMDILFLLDISYNIKNDWDSIKKGIQNISSELIDSFGIDTRIFIVPFSDRISIQKSSISENSIIEIKKKLALLKPYGGAGPENFTKAFHYTIKNIKWRKTAKKNIIVITNSNINKSKLSERFSIIARNKGIRINTISPGIIHGNKSEMLRRIADISGGSHNNITYHQRVFNKDGQEIELYTENSRLFKSGFSDLSWKSGILIKSRYNYNIEKPKNFVSEIFFSRDGLKINPYKIPDFYTRITGERLINKNPREDNIPEVISGIFDELNKNTGRKKQVGRVLLTNDKISFWSPVSNINELNFYEKRMKSGYIFPTGISIRENLNEAYGLTFIPVINNLTSDYIPEMINIKLQDIIKNRKYYMRTGLFSPPVWFVNLKVIKVDRTYKIKDIRDF